MEKYIRGYQRAVSVRREVLKTRGGKKVRTFFIIHLKIYYRVETLVLCIVVWLCEVEIILLYNKLDTFIRVVSCCWANYFIYPPVFYLNANITAEPRAAWNLF